MTLLARRREEIARRSTVPQQGGEEEESRSFAVRRPPAARAFHMLQGAVGNRATAGLLSAAPVLAKLRSEALPAPLAPQVGPATSATPRQPADGSLLVPDGAPAGEGQMARGEFMAAMERVARRAAEAGLAASEHTARGCPWIALYLSLYRRLPAERIEADLRRYVPAARQAAAAADYLAVAEEHIRVSVERWAETGELTGVPRGLPGMGLIAAMAGSLAGVGQLLRRAGEDGPAPRGEPAARGRDEAARPPEHENGDPLAQRLDLGRGRPLDGEQRQRMEHAVGHRLPPVRLHTGAAGARLARRHRARAVAAGPHIAFDRGEYRPGTLIGDALLAHELAHTAQQAGAIARGGGQLGVGDRALLERDADRVAAGALLRLGGRARAPRAPASSGLRLSRCASRTFTEAQLQTYLQHLRDTGSPEGGFYSDDKARQVVNTWLTGRSEFVVTPDVIILLIREMQQGPTYDEDEEAILELLRRLPNSALDQVFGAGGIQVDDLLSDFDGPQEGALRAFFESRFDGGVEALQSGRVQAVGQPRPSTEAAQQQTQADPNSCSVRNPAGCSTYGAWIGQFTNLPTFEADDHFTQAQRQQNTGLGGRITVIGGGPAPRPTDPDAPARERRPPLLSGGYARGDHFMDGPTEQWLNENLPPELVELAYRLPTDCADIAFILRYVWLSAQGRQDTIGSLTCGSASGTPDTSQVRTDIRDTIYARGAHTFVNEYQDDQGNPIRSFEALQPLLRVGDMLTWRHSSGGGHAETILEITRSGDQITSIRTLMGNQPINAQEALQIYREEGREIDSVPRGDTLRAAAGRRLEIGTYSGNRLKDLDSGVWGRTHGDSFTELIAAGPPGSSHRPAAARGQPRALIDWLPRLSGRRNLGRLTETLELVLFEARSRIATTRDRAAIATLTQQAEQVATAAGTRLWQLAQATAGDRGTAGTQPVNETHFQALNALRDLIAGFRRQAVSERERRLMQAMEHAFVLGARGGADIDFNRRGRHQRVLRVLIAGFDPFNLDNSQKAPRRGDFNPSGQAVLALDGETLSLGGGTAVAIEGIVLPVSFEEFDRGLVEQMIGPVVGQLDALITVSLYPRRAGDTSDNLRLERYAVGVRNLPSDHDNPARRAVPAAPVGSSGGGQRGAAIIEAPAALPEVAQAVDQAGQGPAQVNSTIRLRFPSQEIAGQALAALGVGGSATGAEVDISDSAAIQQIMGTMERGVLADSPGIVFRAGTRRFQAIVVEGPGGAFLSNEVSFRSLRMIAGLSGNRPSSFHVHTPAASAGRGESIPQGDPAARRQALTASHRLVERLQTVIRAVVQQRVAAQQAQQPGGAGSNGSGGGN